MIYCHATRETHDIIMSFVIVLPKHVDLMPSEDGQLTETCKGNKQLQIESHWTVLPITL
jgi:hypothetical protein